MSLGGSLAAAAGRTVVRTTPANQMNRFKQSLLREWRTLDRITRGGGRRLSRLVRGVLEVVRVNRLDLLVFPGGQVVLPNDPHVIGIVRDAASQHRSEELPR